MLAKEYFLEMEGADPTGIHQLVPEYLKTALHNLSEKEWEYEWQQGFAPPDSKELQNFPGGVQQPSAL